MFPISFFLAFSLLTSSTLAQPAPSDQSSSASSPAASTASLASAADSPAPPLDTSDGVGAHWVAITTTNAPTLAPSPALDKSSVNCSEGGCVEAASSSHEGGGYSQVDSSGQKSHGAYGQGYEGYGVGGAYDYETSSPSAHGCYGHHCYETSSEWRGYGYGGHEFTDTVTETEHEVRRLLGSSDRGS